MDRQCVKCKTRNDVRFIVCLDHYFCRSCSPVCINDTNVDFEHPPVFGLYGAAPNYQMTIDAIAYIGHMVAELRKEMHQLHEETRDALDFFHAMMNCPQE